MRASWSALHASFTRVLDRDSSKKQFAIMGRTHPGLASFASIASLMDHQRAPLADTAARFNVIRVLVSAAQSDRSYRSTAQMMVIIALWPGLDAVFWRLARGFPSARDDLPAEILARLGEAILMLNLDRVTAVAATLLRNVERDIRRNLITARVIGQATLPIHDPAMEALVEAMVAPVAVDERPLADHLAGLKPWDANLLKRVFLLGETQEEAGLALGLSPAAARKRVQRTLQRLRSYRGNPQTLSHSGPPVGL